MLSLVVFLFGIFRRTHFFTHLKKLLLPVKAANLGPCSALMAISSDGSLACHINGDTGYPFIMVIHSSKDP